MIFDGYKTSMLLDLLSLWFCPGDRRGALAVSFCLSWSEKDP